MIKTRDPRTVAASNGVAADRAFKAVAPPIYPTMAVAAVLARHRLVAAVHYPGLQSIPDMLLLRPSRTALVRC
jgi:hypothetical protein